MAAQRPSSTAFRMAPLCCSWPRIALRQAQLCDAAQSILARPLTASRVRKMSNFGPPPLTAPPRVVTAEQAAAKKAANATAEAQGSSSSSSRGNGFRGGRGGRPNDRGKGRGGIGGGQHHGKGSGQHHNGKGPGGQRHRGDGHNVGASSLPARPAGQAPSVADRPLSGIFAIHKPSGPTSMSLLEQLKPLFGASRLFKNADGTPSKANAGGGHRSKGKGRDIPPKIGQGGTLDPLADGVLVIGVGNGTKHLSRFLDCTKEYYTVGLLGSSTTSYDAMDPVVYRAPHAHVTPELLQAALPQFTGAIEQAPPLYSAVRIDGMRLFDYARQGKELPRAIEKRPVTVEALRLAGWSPPGEHAYKEPEVELPEEEKALVGRVRKLAGETEQATAAAAAQASASADASSSTGGAAGVGPSSSTAAAAAGEGPPAAFALEMTVSSGTYVRSIVHDLARAVGSAAHVVLLTRTRQGEYALDRSVTVAPGAGAGDGDGDGENAAAAPEAGAPADAEAGAEAEPQMVTVKGNCIPWDVFAAAIEKHNAERDGRPYGPRLQAQAQAHAQAKQKQADADIDDDELMNAAGAGASAPASASAPAAEEEPLAEWEQILLAHITPV